MDKDTLKIVVVTQVYIFGYLFTGLLLFFILVPILLRVCNATSVTITFIEYAIRLVLATIIFVAINYTRKRLMLVTKDFMSKNTLMSSSLKPLKDMIIASGVMVILFQVFFFNPQIFGLNIPTFVDYLITFMEKYNTDVSVLDSCWLAEK